MVPGERYGSRINNSIDGVKVEEVHQGLHYIISSHRNYRPARSMDETAGTNIDPIRSKLVTLAMADAICARSPLAEYRSGIWDVPGFWDRIYNPGIRQEQIGRGIASGYCQQILLTHTEAPLNSRRRANSDTSRRSQGHSQR